jgi:hypothetical protein
MVIRARTSSLQNNSLPLWWCWPSARADTSAFKMAGLT